jgi:serine/threonine protein phosphatase 1
VKKFFVLSDIHGHYDELTTALEKAKFDTTNNNHKLIVCGDLFDRGSQNVAVYLFLKELKAKNKAIIIKGNHELFFNDLDKKLPDRVHFNYQYNAFNKTISEFSKLAINDLTQYTNKELKTRIEANYPGFLNWLKKLPFYYETKNYLFTHAGLQLNVSLENNDWPKSVWTESESLEAIDLKKYNINKKLVMGHRPTIILGELDFDIHYSKDQQKIYIDGGIAYNGKINVLVIDDEEILENKNG